MDKLDFQEKLWEHFIEMNQRKDERIWVIFWKNKDGSNDNHVLLRGDLKAAGRWSKELQERQDASDFDSIRIILHDTKDIEAIERFRTFDEVTDDEKIFLRKYGREV